MTIALISGLAGLAAIYIALLALFTRGWYRKMPPPPRHDGPPPLVSVVVAARNESPAIGDLLHDLARQDYPTGSMEVIVVDDGSSDETARIVSGFIRDRGLHHFRLISRLSTDGTGSKKQALLTGIGAASGGVILTTDADCRLRPSWISAMTEPFAGEHIRLVFGPVAMKPGRGIAGKFQALEFAGLVASGAGAAKAGFPFLCNGASLAFRKETFFGTGGYQGHEGFVSGDDVFLLHRVKESHGNQSIAFCDDPRSLVETSAAAGFGAFLSQRARWASKTRGYRDPLTLLTAFVVFLLSLAYVILLVAGIFSPACFVLAAILWAVKSLTDLPLMLGIARFNGQRRLMIGYPVFQAVYPLYVVVAGIWSPFRKKW
jgi:cellulose synthase/poly-beta-1,6-N-acetylglucosamine synthase-like glycosyltransferase